MKRGVGPRIRGPVDVRALLEEDVGDLQVTHLFADLNKGVNPLRSALLHVRAVLQQQLDHVGEVMIDGLLKRSRTPLFHCGPVHLDATPSLPPDQEPPCRLHLPIVLLPTTVAFASGHLPPDSTAARCEGRGVHLRVANVEGLELW